MYTIVNVFSRELLSKSITKKRQLSGAFQETFISFDKVSNVFPNNNFLVLSVLYVFWFYSVFYM